MTYSDTLQQMYEEAEAKSAVFSIISEAKTFLAKVSTDSANTVSNIQDLQAQPYYADVDADLKAELESIRLLIAGIQAQFASHLEVINYDPTT